ncbi:glycosyl transferase, partial [Streptomyces olivaceus]
VFGIGLALTSGSLAALNAASADPDHSTELAVLIAANLAATVLRFLLFRAWVFPDAPPAAPAPGPGPTGAGSAGAGFPDPYRAWSDATVRLQPVRSAGPDATGPATEPATDPRSAR